MKSKRIKTLLASVLTASLILSSSATVFAAPTPPHRNMSAKSVVNMLSNLTAKQREFYEHFEMDALTDVEIKVFPNEVGRRLVEYIAKVNIRDAKLIYNKFIQINKEEIVL